MRMKTIVQSLIIASLFLLTPSSILYPQSSFSLAERYALIIGGPGGQEEFSERYFEQTIRMYRLLVKDLRHKSENIIYLFEDTSYDSLKINDIATAENIRKSIDKFAQTMKARDQLFIFMVGHGTFDGEWSKFNLVGPDLKDIDYARLLAKLPTKKIIIVNASSASGPFIKKLSGEERVIVTATKSGMQYFETNFADFFLDALSTEEADFNKDKRISMLEAFKFARTSQDNWFEENRRLRAEHPLLDDNGDGEGSQDFEDSKDGLWASRVYLGPPSRELETTLQRVGSGSGSPKDKLALEKLKLEQEIEDWKARKDQLGAEEYTKRLETLLIQLARTNKKLKDLNSAE